MHFCTSQATTRDVTDNRMESVTYSVVNLNMPYLYREILEMFKKYFMRLEEVEWYQVSAQEDSRDKLCFPEMATTISHISPTFF